MCQYLLPFKKPFGFAHVKVHEEGQPFFLDAENSKVVSFHFRVTFKSHLTLFVLSFNTLLDITSLCGSLEYLILIG